MTFGAAVHIKFTNNLLIITNSQDIIAIIKPLFSNKKYGKVIQR